MVSIFRVVCQGSGLALAVTAQIGYMQAALRSGRDDMALDATRTMFTARETTSKVNLCGPDGFRGQAWPRTTEASPEKMTQDSYHVPNQ
jgi:hypothetical protein